VGSIRALRQRAHSFEALLAMNGEASA